MTEERQVIVLCYHAVSDHWPEAGAVRPADLERQLRWLVDQGFVGATFYEAVSSPPTGKIVAVTFDDAYRSVLEYAAPILARLRVPGTIFVPTDFIGAGLSLSWVGLDHWLGGTHERELTPMSWSELRALALSGWEIGSHSHTHADLTRLDDASLRMELRGSREACEEGVGRPCRSLAYPYGYVDDRIAAAAHEAGYSAAATLTWRLALPRPLAWPRIGIFRRDGYIGFRLKVSGYGRRLRRPTAWDVVQPVVDRIRRRAP